MHFFIDQFMFILPALFDMVPKELLNAYLWTTARKKKSGFKVLKAIINKWEVEKK